MKRLILALGLASAPLSAFAVLCSVAEAGLPCAPDPGPETNSAKAEILTAIQEAQDLEPIVQRLKAAYVAVRGKADDETQLAIAQPYLAAVTTQEQTYQRAMTLTAELYHVKPRHSDSIAIAAPSTPADGYVAGLVARWNPRVTDSGSGVVLSVKIDGNDGKAHYSGGTTMDPRAPGGRMAITTADGRVLILKDTLALAAEKGNPGFLARVLYHESRHFDRLSWTDKNLNIRGWQNIDREERDAYARDLKNISAFGLSAADVADIRKNHADFANAVRTGVPLTDNDLTPAQEAAWKNHYENIQVNIEEEYLTLSAKVAAERERQNTIAKRLEEERLSREREETRRRAQEEDEAKWRQLERMAGQCGFELSFQNHTGVFMGFRDNRTNVYFKPSLKTPLRMNDMEMAMLVTRACGQVHEVLENRRKQPSPACNGSAVLLAHAAAQPDFSAKLDYLFGAQIYRDRCVNDLFDHASELTDSERFDKFVRSYAKQRKKEAIEYDRRWYPKAPRRDTPRTDDDYPPRDDRPRRSPDHDEVWRRINPIINR